METMQYRDFIFRHNPRSITVTHGNSAVTHFCPGRGEVVQRLGRSVRTVRCGGSFFGDSFEEVAAQLEQFRQTAGKEGPGTLMLPGVTPFEAYLREFVYEADGDGRVIPYTMTFAEAEVGG